MRFALTNPTIPWASANATNASPKFDGQAKAAATDDDDDDAETQSSSIVAPAPLPPVILPRLPALLVHLVQAAFTR